MSKKSRRELGIGSFFVIGIAAGVLMSVVPTAAVRAVVLSGILFGALITSFRSRWSDPDFWLMIAIFLTLHTALMVGLGDRVLKMTLYPLMFLFLPEITVMVIVLLLAAPRP